MHAAMRVPGLALAVLSLVACGDDAPTTPDAGVSTAHCTYEPVPATAHAGGTVTSIDLKRAMEEASGRDLRPLFAEWVFGEGLSEGQSQ